MDKSKTSYGARGHVLRSGGLTVVVPDTGVAARDIRMRTAAKFLYSDVGDVPSHVRDREIDRLLEIMARIALGYPDQLDLFRYLPLTKDGRFPMNRNVLVADSAYSLNGHGDGGPTGTYPIRETVQLRLVPCREPVPDVPDLDPRVTRMLSLDWFDSTRRTESVFDGDGNPSLPSSSTRKYLPDRDIRTGYVYEEKSGARFVCLTGARVSVSVTFMDRGGPTEIGTMWMDGIDPRDPCNVYARWTARLESAMSGADDLNALVRALAAGDRDEPWPRGGRLSVRTRPRKFVREVGMAFDPRKTRAETFVAVPGGKRKPAYVLGNDIEYRYEVRPGLGPIADGPGGTGPE